MSAQATLAGLFPPNGEQIWNENIDWQPVPVHTVPLKYDYTLRTSKQCDRKDYFQMKFENSTDYTGVFEEFKTILDAMRAFTGLPLKMLYEVKMLHSTLFIEVTGGKG